MVMIFQVQEAREQLLKKGLVFTFRKHLRKTGKDWATDKRCGKKIADINVRYVERIDFPSELDPYAGESGFQSLEDWLKAIRKKYPEELSGFLYHVTLLGGEMR